MCFSTSDEQVPSRKHQTWSHLFLFHCRHPYADNPSGLPERTNEAAGAYAKACVDIASTCGIQVADIWTGMQQQDPDWGKLYLSDGLHLTTRGNEFVFEAVLDKLRTQGLRAEGLPVDLPLFSDIDRKDPLKVFENIH
ncbi:hypothetical protein Droror1_Dr00000592 [Drosera rotundifolia]